MAYCEKCGAALPEGARFCPGCGAAAEKALLPGTAGPETEGTTPKQKKRTFRRWWILVLILLAAGRFFVRTGIRSPEPVRRQAVTVTQTPAATEAPAPSPTQPPETSAAGEDEIRPEVREFLDAYEACMDEYVAFMAKYAKADPQNMASMLGDYYAILARYTEFSAKIDALDQSQLTRAELAYYIEVTGRVSQKLLKAAG